IAIISMCFLLSACSQKNSAPEPTDTASESVAPTPSPEITDVSPTDEPTPTPENRTRISRAVTTLLDKSENRLKNIRLAAKSINAYVLKPGEVFSFNKIVGKRSAERGYLPAATIIDGEKKEDFGGGVCQLASTLYQAAESANLEIIERHNHQKDVGYTAPGTDAAVNYGTLDMKFKNSTDSQVMIAVLIGENSVIAEIFKMNY
ncbi:MAG: VanW family protein, partial [Clostridia bacterium]|nr:VanW family protein [Clostridia bacterium]